VVGQPIAFWRENMPSGMFLRSGPDWHIDAASVHTLEAYLEERAIAREDMDPHTPNASIPQPVSLASITGMLPMTASPAARAGTARALTGVAATTVEP